MTGNREYRAAREAAEWLLRFQEQSGPELDSQCQQWRQQAPENEQAWQKAQRLSQRLDTLPTALGMKTLNRAPDPRRRQLLKALMVAAIAAPVGVAGYHSHLWQPLTADQTTATGEQRQLTLSDGSQLQLNTNSSVDIDFSDNHRLIRLYQGEIFLRTGKDRAHHQPRPLFVETRHGRMQALGTVFDVYNTDDHTQLSVLEGTVHVALASSALEQVIEAGQSILFDDQHFADEQIARANLDAWTRGIIVADGMTLGDLIQQLSRYRRGWLRCDPTVANLRISGVFRVDNTDATLNNLPQILPVQVHRRTDYWVTIAAR